MPQPTAKRKWKIWGWVVETALEVGRLTVIFFP